MLETHAIISVSETQTDQLILSLSQNNATQNNIATILYCAWKHYYGKIPCEIGWLWLKE